MRAANAARAALFVEMKFLYILTPYICNLPDNRFASELGEHHEHCLRRLTLGATLIQVATAIATLAIIAGGHRWLSVVSLAWGWWHGRCRRRLSALIRVEGINSASIPRGQSVGCSVQCSDFSP
jgi:hypothetical protein